MGAEVGPPRPNGLCDNTQALIHVPAASPQDVNAGMGRSFAAWKPVSPEYLDDVGDTRHRDWPGWRGRRHTDASGRNDIASAKIACDARNVYFYVHTQAKMTPHTNPNWTQLLIDADRNPKTGWNGYDYVANSRALNASATALKRLSDGKVWPVRYEAVGNE